MNRVPWRRDDVPGPDGNEIDRDLHGTRSDAGAGQPDLDLPLRDAADADTEPERPLLVWPQVAGGASACAKPIAADGRSRK